MFIFSFVDVSSRRSVEPSQQNHFTSTKFQTCVLTDTSTSPGWCGIRHIWGEVDWKAPVGRGIRSDKNMGRAIMGQFSTWPRLLSVHDIWHWVCKSGHIYSMYGCCCWFMLSSRPPPHQIVHATPCLIHAQQL